MKANLLRGMILTALVCLSAAPARAATVSEVIGAIVGDYASGDTALHAARVSLKNTDDAVYLELITAFDELNLTQMMLTFEQDGDTVICRVNSFPEMIGDEMAMDLAGLSIGLWAAPDMYPPLLPGQLEALADVPVQFEDGVVTIGFDDAPTVEEEAFHMSFHATFGPDGATWDRTGFNRGAAEDIWHEHFDTLERVEITPPVNRLENGVVTIDIRKGDGVELLKGRQLAWHFVGVLDDGRRFDSTRFPGHQMLAGPFPGPLMPALADGMVGIKCPTSINDDNRHQQPIRKVIIPPEAGFGDDGLGPVPGGATMYYLALVESVRDKSARRR